jgi:RNA polymerase sigma-70 factor (ECF subfamily)
LACWKTDGRADQELRVLTDEQLVDASLGGADHAFPELVGRYQERLLRFLVTRSASRADAEDALQDTFVNAYRYLSSFDSRWRFSTWIYRIALRNAARQRRPEPHDSEVEIADDSDPLATCIEDAERENVWSTARRLLNQDAYNAMWLRYVEDMSVKEVAAALDRPLSWTKVTLLRGRRRLSDEIRSADEVGMQRESYG